jgi:hypothetical protein
VVVVRAADACVVGRVDGEVDREAPPELHAPSTMAHSPARGKAQRFVPNGHLPALPPQVIAEDSGQVLSAPRVLPVEPVSAPPVLSELPAVVAVVFWLLCPRVSRRGRCAELRSTAMPTQCQRFGDPRTGAGRDRGTSGRGSCRRTPSRTDRHRCAGGRCRESSPPTSGHAYPSHTTSAATSMMTVSVNKSRSHEFMPQNGRTEGRTRDNSLPTDTGDAISASSLCVRLWRR